MKKKKLSKRKLDSQAPSRYIEAILPPNGFGREVVNPHNYHTLIKAFKDWVFICSSKNASFVAKTTFKLYAARQKNRRLIAPTKQVTAVKQLDYIYSNAGLQDVLRKAVAVEEVLEHPFIDLLKNINPFHDKFQFLEITQLMLELTGNAYWYISRNSKFGIPNQLWILFSQFVKIIPSKTTFIEGYTYNKNLTPINYNPEEVLHFKFSNPEDYFYGLSPLSRIADDLNLKADMYTFEKALFDNNAAPEGVLETDLELGQDLFDRLKQEWRSKYGGKGFAGQTPVLEKGVKYKPITFNPRDLNFLNGWRRIQEVIAGVYGIPHSMISAERTGMANAFMGDRQYAANTILPRLRRIEETVNGRLLPMYDDSLFMVFDNPVPDDIDYLLKERESYLKNGVKTINEIRSELGLTDVEWGNTPYMPQKSNPLAVGM